MSDAYSQAGPQGACGTATARAREQNGNPDEAARESRIVELRRQYLNDTYQVDAQELSAALIRQHLVKKES
jgi:anti-sigma28 factor (negative regulator of flagellin synthesis)